jgi:hypothetical protein
VPPPDRRERRFQFGICLVLLGLLATAAARDALPVNPVSRYATLEALVEHGTWSLEPTTLGRRTVDRVVWDGVPYSSKPPLLPALLAPVYASALLLGMPRLSEDPYTATAILRLPFALFPWLLSAVAFGALLRRLVASRTVRALLFVAWTVGGYATVWGATFDNHSFALASLLGAFVCLLQPSSEGPSHTVARRHALGALLLGLAGAFDLGALPIAGLVVIVVATRVARTAHAGVALGLLALFALPIALQAGLQYAIAGTPRPFYLLPEAYSYPGSYWRAPVEFDSLREPRIVYLVHSLVGHHGLFSHTPWLLFALGAGPALRALHPERRWILGAATLGGLLTIGWYLGTTYNYGGRCVGMRWWLVLHPWLGLLSALSLAHAPSPRRVWLFGVGVGWSACVALHGMWSPWEESLVHVLLRALGAGSVPG